VVVGSRALSAATATWSGSTRWPMTSLPIGVDSVRAALVAGLIVGAIIGSAEWFTLRRRVSWRWVLMGAVTGAAVGVIQTLELGRHQIPGAIWWAVATRLPGRLAGS
jgi:Na+/H+-translocating membrane pyrophosphatase